VLSSPENLGRVPDEIVEDAAADEAVWVELSLWPGLFGGRLDCDPSSWPRSSWPQRADDITIYAAYIN
jgi:hypothetical protein